MFCFGAILIELGYFDRINTNFLIVGHTHCNLDQNFSVLSKRIYESEHILTPLAMKELLASAHSSPKERPLHIIQLQSVHDMKNHLSDIINLKLHHFQVPHRFAQFRHVASGMAICQYQLFCPMDGQPDNWLPAAASLLDQNIQQPSIVFNRFAVVNGEGGLLGELIGLAKSAYSNPICQPNNH